MQQAVSLFVLVCGLASMAEAQIGARKDAILSAAQGNLGGHKDGIADAVSSDAGLGQANSAVQQVMATYFPNQGPKAYANCVVTDASRQDLAVLMSAAQPGISEEAAQTVATILQDPETQNCFHEAGLPQLP